MKTVAIIQARMGSTRYPGKVLEDLGGRPVLQWVVDAARAAELVDEVVVAVPSRFGDAAICEWAAKHCTYQDGRRVAEIFDWYVGGMAVAENDVQLRMYDCAKQRNADLIVRLCADAPLTPPENIDAVVSAVRTRHVETVSDDEFHAWPVDYAAFRFADGTPAITTKAAKYPEAFTFAALEKIIQQREHVTPPFYAPGWRVAWLAADEADRHAKNAVDTPEDLERLRCQLTPTS